MLIETLVTPWKKGQSTNSTATAFSALVPTTTKPAKSATRTVIDFTEQSVRDAGTLCVAPYGGNDNNDTFSVKVTGWKRGVPRQSATLTKDLWVSFLIAELACTISSSLPGVAGQDVVATEFFCDTISLTTGIATVIQGTADVDTAWFQVDAGGWELIEITGDLTTGGDTQNWLYWFE
jgi:hypothetical protein